MISLLSGLSLFVGLASAQTPAKTPPIQSMEKIEYMAANEGPLTGLLAADSLMGYILRPKSVSTDLSNIELHKPGPLQKDEKLAPGHCLEFAVSVLGPLDQSWILEKEIQKKSTRGPFCELKVTDRDSGAILKERIFVVFPYRGHMLGLVAHFTRSSTPESRAELEKFVNGVLRLE